MSLIQSLSFGKHLPLVCKYFWERTTSNRREKLREHPRTSRPYHCYEDLRFCARLLSTQHPWCRDIPPIRQPCVGHCILQVRLELQRSGQLSDKPFIGWQTLAGVKANCMAVVRKLPSRAELCCHRRFVPAPAVGQAGGYLNIPHIQNSVHSKHGASAKAVLLETGI